MTQPNRKPFSLLTPVADFFSVEENDARVAAFVRLLTDREVPYNTVTAHIIAENIEGGDEYPLAELPLFAVTPEDESWLAGKAFEGMDTTADRVVLRVDTWMRCNVVNYLDDGDPSDPEFAGALIESLTKAQAVAAGAEAVLHDSKSGLWYYLDSDALA